MDHEIISHYQFTVEAKLIDNQYFMIPVLPIYKQVTIIVEDEDDNPPIFLLDSSFTNQQILVSENTSVGHFVTRISYFDADDFVN